MPTLRDYEQALQRDPADTEAFLALRKVYRESGRFDKLITLYECRAQALTDNSKAADLFYLAAEVRLGQLDDAAGAEVDLAHAVDRDPSNHKATQRLKLIYNEQGRLADLLTLLEVEAAALVSGREPHRIAELQAELARLHTHHVARLEKAISAPGPQRQAEATPENFAIVEALRKVHRALGDHQGTARLYEIELGLTSEPKRRADLMLALGRLLGEKIGDLDGAAQRLAEVVRLRPRDDRAIEALATVYGNPAWPGPDGAERAAGLHHQIARRRQEAGDLEGALASLYRALAIVPGHAESSELIERILYDNRRFRDLDLYYRDRASAAQGDEERMDFLFKRAQLAEGDLGDPSEAVRVYEEIVAIEAPGGPASQQLAAMYGARQDYAKLATLREQQLERVEDPTFRQALLGELASLYRDRLGDAEQSAVYLHALLQIDPGNAEAQQAYGDHFRRLQDWKALLDLLEFSFEHALAASAPRGQLVGRLEEIAVCAEQKLGDADRALTAWQRIEEIEPGHERAREAQKRILQKGKQWDRIAVMLEREAVEAADPDTKIDILKRVARIYIEKLATPERAVETYRTILAIDARDAVSVRALTDIWEEGGRWGDLARLLRSQVDELGARPETLNALRRLVSLYDERLGDLVEASWAATEILQVLPGDRDALVRLEDILTRSGDSARLIQTLDYHSGYVATTDEKRDIVRRIAELLQSQGELDRAVAYWEELLQLIPSDPAALDALVTAYERLEKPEDLARVLQRQIARFEETPAVQAEWLRRLARLATTVLHEPGLGRRAWEDLARVLPADEEALDALAALYRAGAEWRLLVGVLERQIPLATDPGAATAVALERVRVFEEEIRNSAEAVAALEQIINEIDPRSLEAHERLRHISEASGDWQRVVGVAERQLFLTEDPAERVARAVEIATLWRDRLHDAKKAATAFERVVELDPDERESLYALESLYSQAGEADRLIDIDERLLALTDERIERRRLMYEIAETHADLKGEPKRAFEWYRRAFNEAPDEEAMGRLQALAETQGLWEDLIAVHEGERTRALEPTARVAVSLKIARLCEEELSNPHRAFETLRESLSNDPAGETLLPELERLAERVKDWAGLLDVYLKVARARPLVGDRIELLRRRARIREEQMGQPGGALDEYLRSFALDPDALDTREEILRLAEATGRWEDALGVEAKLYARAGDTAAKVEVACRAASLVEEKVKDPLRAFRAYLNAFRLSPDDDNIVANLWRLAGLIGGAPEEPVTALGSDVATTSPEEGDASEGDEGENALEVLELDDAIEVKADGSPVIAAVWHELAQAYESLPTADNETRRGYLLRVADIWERGARDLDRALETLERTFALDTADDAPLPDLKRIAETGSRWDEVCAILLRAAESAPRERALMLHHEIARMREDRGQTGLAEERYQAILLLQPDDPAALNRLEEIFRDSGRWAELAGVLDKRTTGAAEGMPPGTERRRKARELAELYGTRLERPYEAIDTLEQYVGSLDEDDRGGDDPAVIQEACQALETLFELYSRVGMWPKAVEALQRQATQTTDEAEVRNLRWRVAALYEKEIGQPEQAVAAYEALLEADPDDERALAALDRLLEGQGRWDRLQEILARRAERATGPVRTVFIRRRSQLLEERLGNPDAAAASLRELGREALHDQAATEALLRNLLRAGLGHEALRVLQQRVEILTETGATPEQIAAVHLTSAQVARDNLNDLLAAGAAVDNALELTPDNPQALHALAALHLERNDFVSFARVREHEAEALGPTDEAADSFLEAGRVFRDHLHDGKRARACFERAVQARPQHLEAVRALATLRANQGEGAAADDLLRGCLEGVEDPAARATLFTDRARIVVETSGPAGDAIALLDEALALVPDHLPAAMSLADIYVREQQWDQAERRLIQALRRMHDPSRDTAQLYYQLGEVYQNLGRLEDGYRQLQDAERLMPQQLLVRLALGANRYHAKRWREASQYLENVADHPDVSQHMIEVTEGLAQAADAQVKLKHPDRAQELYQSVLQLSPSHGPALKALAELYLEQGKRREAAEILQRLADSASPHDERAQLFEQIGDIYQGLDDAILARQAYELALQSLETLTEDHVPLLEKTLLLERQTGAVAEAAVTAQRLIDLVHDPKERAVRRREGASLLLSQGEPGRAAEFLQQALDDSPADEEALESLCGALDQVGEEGRLVAILDRLLPQLGPAPTDARGRERRAFLWERFAQTLVASDRGRAIAAYESALAVQPDRITAREALAQLYADDPAFVVAAIDNHRRLVLHDVTRDDSLRALAAFHEEQGRMDAARCCYELLALLGFADEEARDFLVAHPAPRLAPDEPYAGLVEDAHRERHLAHPEARVMAEVFAAIWEGVPGLGVLTLETFGASAQDKISPLSDSTLAQIYGQVGKALGNKRTSLHVSQDPEFNDVKLVVPAPTAIVVGAALAASEDVVRLRFLIGRALELGRPEYILAATIPPREFTQLFASVLKAFHPRHARWRAGATDPATEQAAKLKKTLPYKVSKRLAELFQQNEGIPFSSARWREVVAETGNRAGLVMCGSLAAAVSVMLEEAKVAGSTPLELRALATEPGALRELLRFAVSEDYFALREDLGIAARSAVAA